MSRINKLVVQLVGRAGVEVMRHRSIRHALGRRIRLMQTFGIDLVIDVGASVGDYGRQLRRLGYAGRIVSFEPLSAPFERLSEIAAADGAWDVVQSALGSSPGTEYIHVAGNSSSSSLLAMLPRHERSAPESAYKGTERIEITTLDAMFDDICRGCRRPMLKIDTQGYEDRVLAGATTALSRIHLIQLEMSLAPLYAGQALFPALDAQLTNMGYRLVSVEPGFSDERTGELLQFDGIYHRAPDHTE